MKTRLLSTCSDPGSRAVAPSCSKIEVCWSVVSFSGITALITALAARLDCGEAEVKFVNLSETLKESK